MEAGWGDCRAGMPGWGFHDFEEGCQALWESAGSGVSSVFSLQYLWSPCWVWAGAWAAPEGPTGAPEGLLVFWPS